MWTKIWKFIEHNRFTVIVPFIALILWITAVGCIPQTASPVRPQDMVNPEQLELDFQVWQQEQIVMMSKFEFARADLAKQEQQWNEFQGLLMQLASGTVAGWPGLLQLIVGGGFIGLIGDAARKNGVIGGLKRNQ